MLRVGFAAGAMGWLAGLMLVPPVARAQGFDAEPPPTKWFPGESKEALTTPTVVSSGLGSTTTPLLFTPSAPSGFLPTTPSEIASPPIPVHPIEVSVSSRLEPDKRRFHLGEDINLYIDLTWVGEAGDVQPEPPEELILRHLEKKSMVLKDWIQPDVGSQKVVRTYRYLLTPTEEGAGAIEPIEIPYRVRGGGDLLRQTTDRFALEILPRRWPWGKIALGALAALAVVGGGGAAAMGLAARRRRAREAALIPAAPSPFEQMRGHLEAIHRSFTEGAAKDGFDAVERFVRRALGERLDGDFRHATIDELGERLADGSLGAAARDRATSILDRCGRVKFAGYVPTVADQDQVVADCRLLLDDLEGEKDQGPRTKDEAPRTKNQGTGSNDVSGAGSTDHEGR